MTKGCISYLTINFPFTIPFPLPSIVLFHVFFFPSPFILFVSFSFLSSSLPFNFYVFLSLYFLYISLSFILIFPFLSSLFYLSFLFLFSTPLTVIIQLLFSCPVLSCPILYFTLSYLVLYFISANSYPSMLDALLGMYDCWVT